MGGFFKGKINTNNNNDQIKCIFDHDLGVGKGVVGVVARPTGGLIDFASGTFDSVKRVTEASEDVNRVRPPRFLHPDGVVRYYNLREAAGSKYLRDLDKGRYAETDLYIAHEIIPADRQSVLLVSNKRILFISYNQVLGSWTVDWEYSYAEITGPPPCGQEMGDRWYIVIKPKEEKKGGLFGVFGGQNSGKKVFVTSREAARSLARTIESIRTSQN